MSDYIFLTDEGFTFQPNTDSDFDLDLIDSEGITENLQVIGFAAGDNADEAYVNLIHVNSFLKETTFKKIFCCKLDPDYEKSRKNYCLKMQRV